MLEKSSKYEIIPIKDSEKRLLVLYKSTETEDSFVVVAGYFLKETGNYEERVLAEIETVAVEDYDNLKPKIREMIGVKNSKTPITFW